MKKKILALLLACCMLVGLSACGGSDSDQPANTDQTPSAGGQTPAPDTDAEPEKVALTVWPPSEDQNPDLGAWVVTMCDKFNEEHPEWGITSSTACL